MRKEWLVALGIVAGVGAVLAVAYEISMNGPGTREIAFCEAATKSLLRSPATYSRASAAHFEYAGKPKVNIEFDAANAYGTPVRGLATCDFSPNRESPGEGPELVGLTLNGRKQLGDDLYLAKVKAEMALTR